MADAVLIVVKFLSTPSARRATASDCGHADQVLISIHALREEGDVGRHRPGRHHRQISIHALREEGDAASPRTTSPRSYFYPRPPRGGRRAALPSAECLEDISIHALREEGDAHELDHGQRAQVISIHALREEGDDAGAAAVVGLALFLSTPSARRATLTFFPLMVMGFYFYPRPPRGGRLPEKATVLRSLKFLSTPSARRATVSATSGEQTRSISIHALREEGDG